MRRFCMGLSLVFFVPEYIFIQYGLKPGFEFGSLYSAVNFIELDKDRLKPEACRRSFELSHSPAYKGTSAVPVSVAAAVIVIAAATVIISVIIIGVVAIVVVIAVAAVVVVRVGIII